MASVSASLYYFASFIHLAIIPKHLKVGSNLIRPTVSNIPTTESTALPKAILPATWDYVNGLLMIMFLLNLKWAQSGSDQGIDDAILSASAVWGLYVGIHYYRARLYIALVVLWLAPAMSILARLIS